MVINKKGLLLVISGPSGAGKGTICKVLMKRNEDLKLSVSATTRQPRTGEVEGVNYFFLTHEKFNDMISKNEFLEYAQTYSNFYGTPKGPVMECLEKGQDVVLEIEMQGARQVKQIYPDAIIVDPPRKGLDTNTINNILAVEPKKLVYISCNPATMVRDVKLLEEKYEIGEIKPVDMFPFTSHVECVAVLQLKQDR